MRDRYVAVSILLFLLCLFTWTILFKEATWEPFYVFETSDALFYACGGAVLLTLLTELGLFIVVAIATRRLSRWWLLALPVVAFHGLLAWGIVGGWIKDQQHFADNILPSLRATAKAGPSAKPLGPPTPADAPRFEP